MSLEIYITSLLCSVISTYVLKELMVLKCLYIRITQNKELIKKRIFVQEIITKATTLPKHTNTVHKNMSCVGCVCGPAGLTLKVI